MKILTFTTLFPNAAKPHHGIFTQTALKDVLHTGEIETVVVAPTPWFPFKGQQFGSYGVFARIPREEVRIDTRVLHPRYFLPPKVGMNIAPFLLAHAAKRAIRRLMDEGFEFDVIDAHYFYPDGVAAVMLGRHFKKPVVISALGTDVNLIAQFPLPRRMMLWASRHASAIVTVSEALKKELMNIGAEGQKIHTLRNGVDLALFRPLDDRETVRKRLGISGFALLSVGNLVALKGHDRVIEALSQLPGVHLWIAGSGPDDALLRKLAATRGLEDRVRLLGALPQESLREYYGACDALVLASSREGWANVLLESMACGSPVVASRVGGTPEVVTSPAAGVLMPSNTADGVALAVQALRDNYPSRAATRTFAEQFSWAETTRRKIQLWKDAAGKAG